MNESKDERKIETVTCSRCGGTGHYSYNQITGTVCFKCHGGKVVYTKRGRAAADFLNALRSKPVTEVKVGQLVWVNYFFKGRDTFAHVVKSEPGAKFTSNGQEHQHWLIEVDHPKYGGMSMHKLMTDTIRVGWSAEEKAAQLKQALDFQDTLSKTGKPLKVRVIKEPGQDFRTPEVLA